MGYQLFLGDCLEVMRGMEDKSVDAIITDPPFNAGKEFDNDDLPEIDFRAFCNHFALACYRLSPANILIEVGKDDVIMRQEFERYFVFEFSIVLNYTNSMRNGKVGYSNTGLVLWFSKNGKCYTRYMDRIDSALHDTRDEFEHPSPKEVLHYSHLIRMFTRVGDMVLDPFMGSGTTGVACVQSGRNFIGCEINPEYYAIAERRIAQAQPPLFTDAGTTPANNPMQATFLRSASESA